MAWLTDAVLNPTNSNISCSALSNYLTQFGFLVGFIDFLQLIRRINSSVTLFHTFCDLLWHALSIFSLLSSLISPCNGFQRRAFHFLWVPEMSLFLGHSISLLILSQRLLSIYVIQSSSILCPEVHRNSTAVFKEAAIRLSEVS
jgi:hypothetical protein